MGKGMTSLFRKIDANDSMTTDSSQGRHDSRLPHAWRAFKEDWFRELEGTGKAENVLTCRGSVKIKGGGGEGRLRWMERKRDEEGAHEDGWMGVRRRGRRDDKLGCLDGAKERVTF